MSGLLQPVRSRLIETLAGRSDAVPEWIVELERGDDEGYFGPGSAAWGVHGGMPTLVAGSAMVRSLHKRVAGTFVDGHGVTRPYSANDPELASWVHLAFTDAFLTAHERWGAPIPGGSDGYVGEWTRAARLMGVEDAPTTAAELRAAIDAVTDAGELRGGPEVEEIVRFIRRPPLRRMLRPSYRVLFRAAVSTLEPRHRAMLGFRGRAGDRFIPIDRATAAVLGGAGALLGPIPQAELSARSRLSRLSEERGRA